MTAITLILTDAGLAALTNPAHTGTAALTISHIGLSQQHAGDAAAQQALTALPGEFKRLATFGGEVLSPRTIHVFLRDETADAYSLRAFGLYASTGVLLAVVSSETSIMEKVPATTLLQAVDLTFARDIDAELVFGDTNFVNPPATTTRLGVVELATAAETVAGERQDLAVTPWGLAQALLSWAQNFAAKAHRHLINEIDGLSDALAAKANRNHTHGAEEVNAGVFHIDRIPKLTIGWITGLTDQLAGLAAKNHSHPASDINSGQLHLDRLPAIPQSKVSGLVDALLGKSNTDHKHDALDVTSGVFNVARIPALAMEKITGLAAALDAKAPTHNPTFGGTLTASAATISWMILDRTAAESTPLWLRHDGVNRWAMLVGPDANGGNLSLQRYSDDGAYLSTPLSIDRATGLVRLGARPLFGSATPWDSANFNPADKSDAGHKHDAADVVSGVFNVARIPSLAMDKITGLVAALAAKASSVSPSFTGSAEFDGSTGWGRRLNFRTGGSLRWSTGINNTAESGANAGADWTISRYTDSGAFVSSPLLIERDTGVARFTHRPTFAGATAWDSGNFNPADKADVGHKHGAADINSGVFDVARIPSLAMDKIIGLVSALAAKAPLASPALTGTPTAPTPSGGDNSTRIATTGYVRGEINAIPAATGAARGLALLATHAQVQAGTDTSRSVTPAGLWSFARSIGVNGYAQVPGTPLIIQWGRQTGAMSEGQRTVMLPIAFGGGCVAMLANPWNSSPTADYYMQIVGRYLDRLVFMVNSASGSSGSAQGFDWLAVGFATGTPDPTYSTGGGGGGGGGGELPPGGGGGGGEEPIIRPEV